MSPIGSYFFAFAWGLIILAALAGWGSVLSRLLFPMEQRDWALRAAWGLALSVVVGGVLNLGHWISRTSVLFYLGTGIVCWLAASLASIRRMAPLRTTLFQITTGNHKATIILGVLLVTLLAGLRYAASVSVVRDDDATGPSGQNRFYPVDDYQAYMVLPEQMMQIGSLARDPFCSRRMESSLGGQSFLDTFVLSVLPLKHLRLIDPGVGLLLIIALLWGDFKERQAPLLFFLAFALFFLFTGPEGREQGGWANITSFYIGTALFLALARTLAWKALPTSGMLSRAVMIGLIASAICALKSTFIPFCGVFLACSYLFYVMERSSRRAAITELVCAGILTFAFTLPWMISEYQASGTLLYPLLGRGYHQSVYGQSVSPYSGLGIPDLLKLFTLALPEPLFVALVVLGLFYLASRWGSFRGREAVFSLLVAAVVGDVLVLLTTRGVSSGRYSYPVVLAAILMLMAELVCNRSPALAERKSLSYAPLAAVAIAIFLVGWSWNPCKILYVDCLRSIRLGLSNTSLITNQEIAAYRSLQHSVPAKEVILTKLDKPFLLDFKRNPAFVVGWVEESPPPGMPLFQGSEPLARYLISEKIRYVAYSYGRQFWQHRYPDEVMAILPPWFKALQQTYDFQDNLTELGKTRKRIYDDGRYFVLDLLEPSTETTAQRSADVTRTFVATQQSEQVGGR